MLENIARYLPSAEVWREWIVNGDKLSDVGGGALPPTITAGKKRWAVSKIEQIDCVLFDEHELPVYAFEIETSTTITSGIDRFLELIKAEPTIAGRLVLVIPRARIKKLNQILADSHYIGHPLYMENKIGWLYLEDLVSIYNRFAGSRAPTWPELRERLDRAVKSPKVS